MRFVVDNQLSPRLSKFLQDEGHDSVHVAMVGMDTADDRALWAWAGEDDGIRAATVDHVIHPTHARQESFRSPIQPEH